MPLLAIVLIVVSAIFHASWNLIAKKQRMTVPFYAVLCLVGALAWSHAQFWTPVDVLHLPLRFWQFLALTIASEFCYCFGVMLTYRHLDMSTAYPMMRSLPILLTVIIATAAGWGKPLSLCAFIGMAVVFLGCMLMPLKSFRDIRLSTYVSKYMLFVLLAALGTTGYTIGDSETQHTIRSACPGIKSWQLAMTYYSIRGIVLASAMWLYTALTPHNRAIVRDMFRNRDWHPFLAGLFSTSTYILVLTATNLVDNVSYIPVFRQLGLPIGMLAGILILKERCTLTKCIGVTLILTGLVISVIH